MPVLAEYLGDGQLGDPARCALLAIGTPAARALVPEETSLTIHYDAPVGRIADLYAQVQRKGESAVPQLLKALKTPTARTAMPPCALFSPISENRFTMLWSKS